MMLHRAVGMTVEWIVLTGIRRCRAPAQCMSIYEKFPRMFGGIKRDSPNGLDVRRVVAE